MKTFLCSFIFCLFASFSYAQEAKSYNSKNLEVDYSEHTQSSKKSYTFKNLRLYPIRAKQEFLEHSKNMGKYTPLSEALAKKKVLITERGGGTENIELNEEVQQRIPPNRRQPQQRANTAEQNNQPIQQIQQSEPIQQQSIGSGATVNTLLIENVSNDTLYIMAGEIVQGGKQDRVIAQDMIIPPNSGKIDLSVFCVEQGRWTYKKSTDKDNFDGYFGVSSMKMRSVVDKSANQSAVWSEVERANSKDNLKTNTQAYTVRAESKDFKKNMEEYQAYFQSQFSTEKNIIGVVVVTADRVVGCDMFASPQLFQNQFNSLLTAYINEAITDGGEVKISQAAVEKYMTELLAGEQEKQVEQKGKSYKKGKNVLHISTY